MIEKKIAVDPVVYAFAIEILLLIPFIKIIDHDHVVMPKGIEIADKATPDKAHGTGYNNHVSTATGDSYASIGGQTQTRFRSP